MISNNINRDLSWLSFNERVLQEAQNEDVPLIERLRFLGIYSNNLDEFFRVRVATNLRLRSALRSESPDLASYYANVVKDIETKVVKLQKSFNIAYEHITKALKAEGVDFKNEKEFSEEEAREIRSYFLNEVESYITPIILSNVKKFPYLKDTSVYLFIILTGKKGKKTRALIELPTDYISRFYILKNSQERTNVAFLDDIIRYNLPYIFSIFNPVSIESYTIKLTRDAELDLDDDFSQSYYNKVEKSLKKRKKGKLVRFVHDREIDQESLTYLLDQLNLKEGENIISGSRYHNSRDFIGFPDIDKPYLIYDKVNSVNHKKIEQLKPLIKQVQKQDLLFHFPYHSFDYVIDIIREASIDPKVRVIKISLYRVASKSKVIKALKNAARNGKKVEVVIELQARFDEKANLYWSKQLKDENIDVRFGIQGLKIHSKILLIQRKSGGEWTNYAFIGTGNFHEKSAKVYCDTALFTANQELADEVNQIFQLIEKPYLNYSFNRLLVSPVNIRQSLESFVKKEKRKVANGKRGHIFIKVNNLVDDQMIACLLDAAEAGVVIKLLVRGVCALKPTSNIEIRSIVGRYLEHSRVYCFGTEEDAKIYIGSTDLMTRNLDVRVEVLAPILDKNCRQEMIDYLNLQWSDNTKARILNAKMDNKYHRNSSQDVNSQNSMYHFLTS